MMEQNFIAWVKQRSQQLPQVEIGIGDDAAVLASKRPWVVTCDSLCENTHFRLDCATPRQVGRKLAAVNLSDLAAMAADPVAFFISLCLPRSCGEVMAVEIMEGVFELAEKYGVAIAGGDTNSWDAGLVAHLTAVGHAPRSGCWLRSQAQPGDAIVVSGTLGGSILGKHLHFEPRLRLSKSLCEAFAIHAAIDVSDGLSLDLLRVATASRCGAVLDLTAVPISDAAKELSITSGKSPLEHALGDGEDFELLLAIPKSVLPSLPSHVDGIPLTVIGEFVTRTGLWTIENGQWRQLPPRGYEH